MKKKSVYFLNSIRKTTHTGHGNQFNWFNSACIFEIFFEIANIFLKSKADNHFSIVSWYYELRALNKWFD